MKKEKLNINEEYKNKKSAILKIPIHKISTQDINTCALGTIQELPMTYLHDLVKMDKRILSCSADKGEVKDLTSGETIFKKPFWIRGITFTDSHIFIGASKLAERKKRCSKNLNGYVFQLNRSDFSEVKTFILPSAGQVNDMITC